MKKCAYCGKEYPDDAIECAIDRRLLEPAISAPPKPILPPSKLSLAIRRIVSFVIGTLMFLIVAPEFAYMPRAWALFWIIFPLAPILCVCFGAGRNRFVEGSGWVLHVAGIMMFLSDV